MSSLPYLGYNFSSPIDGSMIPQRLQNLCIRDYAQSKSLTMAFPIAEYWDASQSLMLMNKLDEMDKISGFVFYSVMLLPIDPVRRREFYARTVKAGKSVHFALEDLSFNSEDSAAAIERVYRISADRRLNQNREDLMRFASKPSSREVSFITPLHTKTKRDYVGRVTESNKAENAEIAKKFGQEYWDGDRRYGYGGHRYDGRWASVASKLIERYGLTNESKVLDVGCGKAFLLYELKKLLPGLTVRGLDISAYGIKDAKEEVRPYLVEGHARRLPFNDGEFDLVISIMTFHNLFINDLFSAIKEMRRVSKTGRGYIAVESYRNETEKMNLLYWQLTCRAFMMPEEWVWLYNQCGFEGDYEFVYFE